MSVIERFHCIYLCTSIQYVRVCVCVRACVRACVRVCACVYICTPVCTDSIRCCGQLTGWRETPPPVACLWVGLTEAQSHCGMLTALLSEERGVVERVSGREAERERGKGG